MKNHSQSQGLARIEIDRGPGQSHLFVGIGRQLLSQKRAQVDAFPLPGRQQVLGVGQGQKPRLGLIMLMAGAANLVISLLIP